jgi:excisionase family DNA binding protein
MRSKTDEWVNIQQLAEELEIAARTIYNWRVLGKGPKGYKIGSAVRFRRSDVDAWLDTLADDGPEAA